MKKCMIAIAGVLGMLAPASEVENYQVNGSFEYAANPDIPDCWTPFGRHARSAIGVPPEFLSKENIEALVNRFVIDETTSVHGKKSLRTEAPFFIGGISGNVEPNRDYTISVYLKSSRPNMAAELSAVTNDRQNPYRSKRLDVSTEWTRYELNLPRYPHNKLAVLITPLDTGKLWADAVQVEEGLKATAFVPSKFDAGFTRPQPRIHIGTGRNQKTPSVTLGKALAKPPVIDGVMDDCWKSAPEMTMNTIMGAPSEVPTRIRAAWDKENLYLFFDCSDPAGNNGKGESMEIFLDLPGIGSPYYQFIFDPKGRKRNYRVLDGKHEWTWQGDWQLAVRPRTGGWTAEVVIPLKQFAEFSEIDCLEKVKMNFARNYPPGPEIHLSWAPVNITFLEPEKFGTVYLGEKASETTSVSAVKLTPSDAVDHLFSIRFNLSNNSPEERTYTVFGTLETATQTVQSKTIRVKVPAGSGTEAVLPNFKIADSRARIGLAVLNEAGKTAAQWRGYLDTPHVLEIFSEYSYYTHEKTARIAVNSAAPESKGGKLVLSLVLEPLPAVLEKREYPFDPAKRFYEFPLNRPAKSHTYTIRAELFDAAGKKTAASRCDLLKLDPHHTEVKVNRISRGMYVNGKPYIPYGYQVWLLNEQQLGFYKTLGHDYICYTGHWGDLETNRKFLSVCERLGLKVMNFYAVRPNAEAPAKMLGLLKDSRAPVAAIPVDECVDHLVPRVISESKCANPYLVTYRNDNIAGYRYWRNRPDGLFGDAFSIDRYPLILLPKGLPQTPSMIYSFERVLELLDEDCRRERKPLFIWMQAAEAQSKEPTRDELVFLHYIAVVNHCMGFTYFGGVPISRYARETILRLDRELKTIQPFLFSPEDDVNTGFTDEASRDGLRVLAKKLENEFLVICINRTTDSLKAGLALRAVTGGKDAQAEVLFEGRKVPVRNGVLQDTFPSFGRHVYRIAMPKQAK
ncbi:MAG: Endo-1,4-beta-xylanase A precursor [Lentisphaerae bacterium ADurb.Bin242]|nr:MAG: Endo-1,4-beta-xylanase A precursor [Lentisphaerae bacterium ADurb.Bin242]